jgi:hypothetical protein
MLVTPFQSQIATFSVKNVIFAGILRLDKIESNSLNQTALRHVPQGMSKLDKIGFPIRFYYF